MDIQISFKKTFLQKMAGFFLTIIPFCTTVILILVFTFILTSKIKAKKAELVQQQSHGEQLQKSLTNVVTMKIKPTMIRDVISLPGVAKPWISLEVVAEIRGRIINKKVKEGQQVKKGDILAIIDKRDYRNAYNSALASYETAKASEKRLAALVKKKFATQSQLDDAVARLKTTKANFDNARLRLDRCAIYSPMEGIIDTIHIENGSFLNSGDPVAKILRIDKLKVEVGIPESDVDAVRKLNSFEMVIDALDGKKYTGYFHHLHKTADSFARLYTLEIRIENPEMKILPDMFARVNIVKTQDPEGLAVPMYAIVNHNNQIGIFVEKDGNVQFRPVQAGFMAGWKTQIKKGVKPNDHVVVVGHRFIENGNQVNVTKIIDNFEELSR
ncbi:efflux RND transporter periplasmic adaptor subunit [Desulfobacula sp.]|uniref:efflux RND transporter periplasmic adaptor subunit n=1 Tax=Desulfobacula sp. TaxID=2593537 RepID=UPI00260CF82E|nr:efflux RND transporter periplasmic adaptor subunit [Desulfobacula sp.]